jgi:hypothetical protein
MAEPTQLEKDKEYPMKTLAFAALFALTLGCAGSEKGETANTQKVGQLGDEEPMAGDDAAGNVECAQEIALQCAEGSVDGCSITGESGETLTSYHICVPEGESLAGTPCENEIFRECPEGFTDACSLEPAAAAIHACVAAPVEDEPQTEEPGAEEEADVEQPEAEDASEATEAEAGE